jgi:hypothetical protein
MLAPAGARLYNFAIMQADIYTPYILASYAAAFVVLGGAAAYVVIAYIRTRRRAPKEK